MATFVLKNAYFDVNGVNLTSRTRQVTLSFTAEEHDDTVMGATYRSKKLGLADWTINATFLQDYAAANVDATLFPLVGSGSFSMNLYPSGSTSAADNPRFSGNVVLAEYTPLDSAVGDLAEVSVTFLGAGTLTRSV